MHSALSMVAKRGTAKLSGLAPPILLLVLLLVPGGCANYDADQLLAEAVVDAKSAHWDDALVKVERALRAQPGHLSSLILRGLCLHHLQDDVKAEEVFRDAAQSAPGDFGAQFFHGWMLCEMEMYRDALAPLRKAHDLRPDHPEAMALLARCYLEQELYGEGIGLMRKLIRDPTYGAGPAVYNGLALLYLWRGDMQAARNFLFAAYRHAPDNPVVAQNLAVLHDQYLGKPADAVKLYAVALSNSQKAGDRGRAQRLRARLQALSRERRARE
jgi:Tfp pilus assembly protein PilF